MSVGARMMSIFAETASVEAAETNLDARRVVLELDDSESISHRDTDVC